MPQQQPGAPRPSRRHRRFEAVLFDFHGTLVQVEDGLEWVVGAAAACGHDLDEATAGVLAEALAAGGWPVVTDVPAHLADLWRDRDLTQAAHRGFYTGLVQCVDSGIPGLPEALYERLLTAAGWRAYADTVPVLRALREAGLPVAIVSNIGFDIRPVVAGLGFADLVDAFVLSYEVGACKPDPAIFVAACDALGVAPASALMVGDTPADAGAVTTGCRCLILPASPADAVHGLRAVVDVAQVTC
jgi:HAD superfamily hydrolase (TIGR01509 family)